MNGQMDDNKLDQAEQRLMMKIKPGEMRERWLDIVADLLRQMNFTWQAPIQDSIRNLGRLRPVSYKAGVMKVGVPDDLAWWAEQWRLAMIGAMEKMEAHSIEEWEAAPQVEYSVEFEWQSMEVVAA